MRIIIVALVLLTAPLAFADGYPEQKYSPKDRDPFDGSPSLKAPKKKGIAEPGAYKPDPEILLPKKPEKTMIMPVMDLRIPEPPPPRMKSTNWDPMFRSGFSFFGGTGDKFAMSKFAFAGVTLNGGWIPVNPVSINLDLGATQIYDQRPVDTNIHGVYVQKKYNLLRAYTRASLLISPRWGNTEVPLGVYHARALLPPGADNLFDANKWKNTFRETGATIGVFYSGLGVSFDYGYNEVVNGYTANGWTASGRFNYLF